MKKGFNYEKRAIEEFKLRYKYSEDTARRMYRKTYRQILKLTDQNAALRTHKALFSSKYSLNAYITDDFHLVLNGYIDDIEEINERTANMANHYPEVKELLNNLNEGKITVDEYLDKIKEFKKTNKYRKEHAIGSK